MQLAADEEEYAETDDAPQDHHSCHTESWTCSLGDGVGLFRHHKSTLNLGQHSLCRCNPVVRSRKPQFGFAHLLTPQLVGWQDDCRIGLTLDERGSWVPRSPERWNVGTLGSRASLPSNVKLHVTSSRDAFIADALNSLRDAAPRNAAGNGFKKYLVTLHSTRWVKPKASG